MNRTRTLPGARHLRALLVAPPKDVAEITLRSGMVRSAVRNDNVMFEISC